VADEAEPNPLEPRRRSDTGQVDPFSFDHADGREDRA
jgi:hypothetical protein